MFSYSHTSQPPSPFTDQELKALDTYQEFINMIKTWYQQQSQMLIKQCRDHNNSTKKDYTFLWFREHKVDARLSIALSIILELCKKLNEAQNIPKVILDAQRQLNAMNLTIEVKQIIDSYVCMYLLKSAPESKL